MEDLTKRHIDSEIRLFATRAALKFLSDGISIDVIVRNLNLDLNTAMSLVFSQTEKEKTLVGQRAASKARHKAAVKHATSLLKKGISPDIVYDCCELDENIIRCIAGQI